MTPALRTRLDTALLVLATLVGTVPGTLLVGVGLARRLPFAVETRFAVGFGLLCVVWLAALSWCWLSKTGLRATLGCVAFALVGALLAEWS